MRVPMLLASGVRQQGTCHSLRCALSEPKWKQLEELLLLRKLKSFQAHLRQA